MQLDLNLLAALDALLEEGSVGAAAERLRLSAPAMSRTLGRIRRATGDEILVRTGRTMTPTPYAVSIRATVHGLVQQAHEVLAPSRELELATLDRTFTLRWHDAVVTAVGPGLLAAVQAQAPGVRLRFLGETSTDTNDLRQGRVDLEVGATRPALPDIHAETVAHDHLVVAVHRTRRLDLDRYLRANHLAVSRRGRLRDPIDDILEAQGLQRRVIAAVPTVTAALDFIRHNEALVSMPALVNRAALLARGLRTLPLPVDAPPVPIVLAWHQRYDRDRAHTWLRDLTRDALRQAATATR